MEFDGQLPFQNILPIQVTCNSAEYNAITNELSSFLDRGIIDKTDHCADEFISHIFTRPKSGGRVRIILNLTKLNELSINISKWNLF